MKDEREVEQWSIRRWKQLEELERLLIDCESLDSANCIIDRLKRLIAVAKKLRDWGGLQGREPSFVSFLREQARVGYDSRRKRKTKGSTQTK